MIHSNIPMISLNVIHYHHSTTIEIINNIDDSRDKNVKKKGK